MIEFKQNTLKSPLINHSHLKYYLLKNGWELQAHKNKLIELYSNKISHDQYVKIVLPAYTNVSDYRNRLRDAIEILSAYEGRNSVEIINSINAVYRDVLGVRISKDINIESIGLDAAIDIINNIKKLIEFSASAELEVKPHYPKPHHDAENFIADCKFGHTFRGSFGFTIETPNIKQELPTAPFSRKVVERIIKGLHDTQSAVLDRDLVVKNIADGLNFNMCEALIQIMNKSKGDVEYSVRWSPEYETSNSINGVSIISLGHEAISYLEFVRDQLMPADSINEIKHVTIKGKIIQLKAESIYEASNRSKEPPHKITIVTDYDGNETNIRVNLNADIYIKACQAHMEEKFIQISGDLDQRSRPMNLTFPHDIHILDYHESSVIEDNKPKSPSQVNLFGFEDQGQQK